MLLRSVSAITGIVVGTIIWLNAPMGRIPVDPWIQYSSFSLYGGTVENQDTITRLLTLSRYATLPLSTVKSRKIVFSYDRNTKWYYTGYIVKDEITFGRFGGEATEFEIPPGTLVRVLTDPNRADLYARAIVIFRRKSL